MFWAEWTCCIDSYSEEEYSCQGKSGMCHQLLGTCSLDVKGVDSSIGERRAVSREYQLAVKRYFFVRGRNCELSDADAFLSNL
jgi:hypothetical protein